MSTRTKRPTPNKEKEGPPKQLWDSMNAELRDKYKIVRKLVEAETTQVLRNRWEMGTELLEIEADPDTYGGQSAVKTLLSCFPDPGVKKDVLLTAMRFARAYPHQHDLEGLLAARNKKGHALSWTHIVHLLRIKDEAERDRFQEEWHKHSWSAKELAREIEKAHPARTTGAGRPAAKPADFDGFLTDMTKKTATYRRLIDLWCGEDGITEVFKIKPLDEYTKADRRRLEEVLENFRETRDELNAMEHELERLTYQLEEAERARTRRPTPSMDEEEEPTPRLRVAGGVA